MSANVNTIERIMTRLFKIEYGIVVSHDRNGDAGVQCRDDADSEYWNTVTVKVKSTKTRVGRTAPSGNTGDPFNVMHYYCVVLQGYNQKWAGHPYMPRIGDMVAVLFMFNQMPLVLGTVYHIEQDPVCRSPFNIKDPVAIDARYDDVTKWCQWREPEWNADMEVVEHKPGKNPICHKKFHRTRDYINVWDCKQGDKNPCNWCEKLDWIRRACNQWEKVYSNDTDSCDCQHPYLGGKGVCYTKRRHEWHEPCGSYFVFQNNPCGDLDYGKGLIRLENAISECCGTGAKCSSDAGMRGHLNMDPKGTIDLHTKHEDHPYAAEHEGTRMSVVALDDSTVDHSFEAIDYNIKSWIEIWKTGDINLVSKNYSSMVYVQGTQNKVIIEGTDDVFIHGNDQIYIKGDNEILNESGGVIYETCSDHVISTHCTHPSCSCSDSDRRLKRNIIELSHGLNEVIQLNPVSFNFKKNDNLRHLGFIAQDVEHVIPEVVETRSDSDMMGIRYDELIPVLVNAIKELNMKVETLEKKLSEVGQ